MNNLHFITCFCLFPPKHPVFVDTVIMLDLQSPGCLMGTYGIHALLFHCDFYTLSLPILATTMVPCLAENETLPSIDFAVPRAFPSRA